MDKLVCPSCEKELPAPLDGVAVVICPCGKKFTPAEIYEHNYMEPKTTPMQEEFDKKFGKEGFITRAEMNEHVKAWIGKYEKVSNAKAQRDMLRGIISGHRIGFSITDEIQELIDKLNKVIGGK